MDDVPPKEGDYKIMDLYCNELFETFDGDPINGFTFFLTPFCLFYGMLELHERRFLLQIILDKAKSFGKEKFEDIEDVLDFLERDVNGYKKDG